MKTKEELAIEYSGDTDKYTTFLTREKYKAFIAGFEARQEEVDKLLRKIDRLYKLKN